MNGLLKDMRQEWRALRRVERCGMIFLFSGFGAQGSGTSMGEPDGFDDVHGGPICVVLGGSWRRKGCG